MPPLSPSLFADTRLVEIHETLTAAYGTPPGRVPWDPLKQLVYSMLTARTRTETSHAALRALELRYKTATSGWERLRDAPLKEVVETVAAVTFPEKKAFDLQNALRRITRQNGSRLSLDFFEGQPTERIRRWLESFRGIGAEASAAIVNFSTLRRVAIAVDGHHHRISLRLQLVPAGTSAAVTEQRLLAMAPADWTAPMLDEHHSLIKLHGQRCCTTLDWERNCPRCPLLGMCPTGEKTATGPQF